jgi:hypothetical protein
MENQMANKLHQLQIKFFGLKFYGEGWGILPTFILGLLTLLFGFLIVWPTP